MNDYDVDEERELSPSEIKALEDVATGAASRGTQHGRSNADDVIDAIAGGSIVHWKRLPHVCPRCESNNTRTRKPGVGRGVARRRCRDCRNEWAVGMSPERAEVDAPPPDLAFIGPYSGESGPPIDHNQPFNRRVAEVMRRATTNEP